MFTKSGFQRYASYEVRDLTVDEHSDRPTVWIPVYRPPSKMVKVQVAN